MAGKMRDRGLHERDGRLDQFGSEIIRASSLEETDADDASSSPFLYSRIRSRISAELSQRKEKENWLSMLIVLWRAVPAMALVAIICVVLFWSASPGVLSNAGFVDDAILTTTDSGIEGAVFADRQPLSSDEVLVTILNKDDSEVTK